jgi:catechol 2,3-dioxygenase-like lactoylglutathione lyase family enzyme/GNAT superfamily N-acetyltransferase
VITVARFTGSLPDALGALVAESEASGVSFVRRLADEWTSGANRFDGRGEALFVARTTGSIVGVCGLTVDPYALDDNVGRVRHLYVARAHRRQRVGRRLVEAVIGAACGRFDALRLRTHDPGAARFYERLGFRAATNVPHCTHLMELHTMRLSGAIPQLRTTDLDASIRFYTTTLGLALEFRYEDFYAGIRAGRHLFHLKLADEKDPSIAFVDRGGHFHLYLETDDVAAAADALKGKGVPLVQDVHDTPWGTREFVIKDDQGHTLYIGSPA